MSATGRKRSLIKRRSSPGCGQATIDEPSRLLSERPLGETGQLRKCLEVEKPNLLGLPRDQSRLSELAEGSVDVNTGQPHGFGHALLVSGQSTRLPDGPKDREPPVDVKDKGSNSLDRS